MQRCPGRRQVAEDWGGVRHRGHVHLEEDQVLVGSHRRERSRRRFRADQVGQDQFDDVGHDLDLGFQQPCCALADIHGERGGQQPGGPPLQRRGQTERRLREGPELVLQVAQRPAGRAYLLRYNAELVGLLRPHRAACLAQLESCCRKLLDRPVMQEPCQVTAFPCAKPAHAVKQKARRGTSRIAAVLGQGAGGGASRAVIAHQRLPLGWPVPDQALVTIDICNITYSNMRTAAHLSMAVIEHLPRRSCSRRGRCRTQTRNWDG